MKKSFGKSGGFDDEFCQMMARSTPEQIKTGLNRPMDTIFADELQDSHVVVVSIDGVKYEEFRVRNRKRVSGSREDCKFRRFLELELVRLSDGQMFLRQVNYEDKLIVLL